MTSQEKKLILTYFVCWSQHIVHCCLEVTYNLTPFLYCLAICASTSCCCWPSSNQHCRPFSVQSNVPLHRPENTKPQIPHFFLLLHCPCVCIFLYILSYEFLICCTALGCFKWNCLVGCPLQEARWGCGMPSISPGSIGNSRSLPLGKAPDMNLLLRQRLSHCFQLWLLLRSSVQSIIYVSGGQRKRHIHTQKYVMCTCKNKLKENRRKKNFIFMQLTIYVL